jgi:hypothetical protein
MFSINTVNLEVLYNKMDVLPKIYDLTDQLKITTELKTIILLCLLSKITNETSLEI